MGRHAKLTADKVATLCQRATVSESKTAFAEECGISRATLYAAIKAAP